MPKKTKDIFISYRREDNNGIAREIAISLENRGFSVFFDREKNSIAPGDRFPNEIEEALCHANDFLVIVSRSYFGRNSKNETRFFDENDWCRREIKIALENHTHIIPIVLDPSFFKIDAIDMPDDARANVDDIKSIFDINYIEYSRSENTDDFIDVLQESLTEQSVYNSKRNYYKDKLLKIEAKQDNSTVNIDLRELVLLLNEEMVLQFLYPLLEEDEPLALQFLAYYAIYTYYRRMAYQSKVIDLVARYSDRFDDDAFPFNSIIKSQTNMYLYNKDNSDSSKLDAAIFHAERAVDRIHSNSGVLVNYADLVADAAKTDERYKKCISKAIVAIKQAMELHHNYPKHYYTLGLLEGINGNYDEGIHLIQTSIDLENSESKDAFLRIIKCYDAIQDIKIRKLKHELFQRINGE